MRRVCFLGLVVLLGATPLLACKLPVFRYALERWGVDQYRLVALVSDPDAEGVSEALEALKGVQADQLNAAVEIVNLSELTDEQWWQFEGLEEGPKNRLQVYFPLGNRKDRLGWTGDLSVDSVRAWQTSPLRKSLISDLSSGVSAVWLLVEGDKPEVNDRAERELLQALETANREISIPDGVIAPDQAAEYFRSNPGASMDDVLRCSVPLRVDFRWRRVSQQDTEEVATLAMLRALGVTEGQTWLVPVFGRGRMLDAIPGDPISASVVLNACKYMVGECSCTVKAQNPGVDLLLNVDWPGKLGVEALVFGSSPTSIPELLEVPSGNHLDGPSEILSSADGIALQRANPSSSGADAGTLGSHPEGSSSDAYSYTPLGFTRVMAISALLFFAVWMVLSRVLKRMKTNGQS